ncbi:MAG TPA: metallopeptidase TldD-related protein [Acidimicrobiales bacterium]|nr:metallopeptidase TldD-related protein [Acidimicrobiales bacterium]
MTGRGSPGLPAAPDVVEEALEASRATACVVIVDEVSDANVRFANNTTTTNGVRRDRRVTVVSVVEGPSGTRAGVAAASVPLDIAALVAASESVAADSEPADDASPLEPTGSDADFETPPEMTDLGVFAPLLEGLGPAFASARAEGRVLAGFASHELRTTYLGSTAGGRRRHVAPTGAFELVARTADGSASSWAGVGTPNFADVSLAELDAQLRHRLDWARRRIDLEPGRYEVILPPDAVADLVLELDFAASGREAEDGGTVYSAGSGRTRIGERLTGLPFVLWSDPRAPGLECAPFVIAPASSADTSVFDNGQPIGEVYWIRDGVLDRLRYHRAGARRSHVVFAPPADNLLLALPGVQSSFADLVAHTERGLLLTCLWYIREVDRATLLLTGLTRDGVYLVDGGEVVGAVNNFRFNESPLDVLGRTIEASQTVRALSREWHEWANRTAMPGLRVAEFNMSSVSPAS